MPSDVNHVLTDKNFLQWKKNLLDLSKPELEHKEQSITHALDSKKQQNQASGKPADEGTNRLIAQLEACHNELAKCALETQVLAVMQGAQPFGIEQPQLLTTVKCKLCSIHRETYIPAGDFASLTEISRKRLVERVSLHVHDLLTKDHQQMRRHAKSLIFRVLLRA